MSKNSKIEWTDHTFNPWIGCTKVSPACDHCYAEVSTPSRALSVTWGAGQPRRVTGQANWKEPIKWNKRKFYQCGCGWRGHEVSTKGTSLTDGLPSCPECDSMDLQDARQRVFCASLADVFDKEAPLGARERLFELIEQTPNLDWLLLTKRIGNVIDMLPTRWAHELPRNIWLGISVVNQQEADRDIAKLLEVPAAVRFLSMEPLLGLVDLRLMEYQKVRARDNSGVILTTRRKALDWVIVGGESGAHARPMNPDWARSLRDQCASVGVPFLFKQWGEWCPDTGPLSTGKDPIFEGKGTCARLAKNGWEFSENGFTMPLSRAGGDWVYRLGKKAAGRLLDGRTHDEFPKG